jgi:tetratricopeptide (TPR) repeat protein
VTEKPSVSLCLITRNEERNLPRCLQSVTGLVSEIIVVDTGSTDSTCQVAREFGAVVEHFPWNDNFSDARNASLELATGDWILVLDADEVLAPVPPEEFVRLLLVPGVEGYYVKVRNYLGNGQEVAEDYVVRLFRNKPFYRFQGAIHEQVAGVIKTHNRGKGLGFSDLVIEHFGYLDQEVEGRDKHQRNIAVIKKALAAKPSDPFLLYSLGIEYFQCGEISKGIKKLEKALTLMRGDEGYFCDLLLLLGLGLLQTNQRDQLLSFLEKGLQMLPQDPALHLLKGALLFADGCYDLAVGELRYALERGSRILPRDQVLALLGDAYNLLGLTDQAEVLYFQAVSLNPNRLYPLTQLLGLKQRKRSRLSWQKLSSFTSLTRKKAIWKELVRFGELPMALVIVLLALIDPGVSSNDQEMFEICRGFRLLVEQCCPETAEQELVTRYLLIAAGEMLLYIEANRRGLFASWFSLEQRLFNLASMSLELTVKVLCPPWAPSPVLQLPKELKSK